MPTRRKPRPADRPPPIAVRLPVDVYTLLQQIATDEERSLGGVARRIIAKELRGRAP